MCVCLMNILVKCLQKTAYIKTVVMFIFFVMFWNAVMCCCEPYLVVGGRDRTPDRAAAAGERLWLGRRGAAAAAGRGVVVPGVVLVHDPGEGGRLQ